MATGENNQAFLKITDMTRLMGLSLLALHSYYFAYSWLLELGLTHWALDLLLIKCRHTGLFERAYYSKGLCLILLSISLLGTKARKQPGYTFTKGALWLLLGLAMYWGSSLFLLGAQPNYYLYLATTLLGFLVFLVGGTQLSRILHQQFNWDHPFNDENETFPQFETRLMNPYSINLPAEYRWKNRMRSSWINIINPFRALLVLGTPGSGKSYFVIRHVITQHLEKGFTMLLYDFKYDDLTKIAYYTHQQTSKKKTLTGAPPKPSFYVINFEDLSHSHRCNPFEVARMKDRSDVDELARTLLCALNRDWIKRQGEYFVESAISLVTGVIWFLKSYEQGRYCTLPHVIELLQTDYERLFSILRLAPENETILSMFINAYLNGAMEQLEGQVSSAKVSLGRLSSPRLYYVLSGNDFSLDLNNPEEPKILCLGSNPQKSQIYGAVLSLYINQVVKLINQPGKLPCSMVFDEFPTIFLNEMSTLIATARSNKVATTLGIQDFTQLRKDYGREQADVLMNLAGSVIAGQVNGDTAKLLSERIGKILQLRPSFSVNSSDTSHSFSRQLDYAVPVSKIATLSSGEFVGIVADDAKCPIPKKAFHARIVNDHKALEKEQQAYQAFPLIRKVTPEMVQENYTLIRRQTRELVDSCMERLYQDPALRHLLVNKAPHE